MTSKSQTDATELKQVLRIVLGSALLTVAVAIAVGMPTAMSDVVITVVVLFAISAGGFAYVVPNIAMRGR